MTHDPEPVDLEAVEWDIKEANGWMRSLDDSVANARFRCGSRHAPDLLAEVKALRTQRDALVELVEEAYREAYQTAFSNGLSGGSALGGGYHESDPDGDWNASDTCTALRRITGEGE